MVVALSGDRGFVAPARVAATSRVRARSLDVLRAVALIAMIVDHVSLLVFAQQELGWNGRAVGRIAEPIFVVLAGYLLAGRSRATVARRMGQLFLAELLIAPLFFGVTQSFDILASLIPVLGLYLLMGDRLVWLLPAFLLAPLDPIAPWFGYDLTLVLSQVALGMLLRQRHGWLGAGLFLVAGLVPAVDALPLYLSIPVAGLVLLAARHPDVGPAPLAALGRRPLTWYVAHLWVVAIIGVTAGRLGWTFPLVERTTRVTYTRLIPIFPR